MLFVDYRDGSNYLAEPLEQLGLPVYRETTGKLPTLPFGDISFEGRGNDDAPVQVGIEFKRFEDLVTSMRSGRLQGHQLPGMLGPQGAYHFGWLLIEGRWSTNNAGIVTLYKEPKGKKKGEWKILPGQLRGSELEKRLLTLEMLGGVHVRFTPDRRATLYFIQSLFRWFTDKSMDRHTTHLDTHRPSSFLSISTFRAIVKDHFPGIGLRASIAVERAFGGSMVKATTANVDEWARIEIVDRKGKTKRIGTKTAEAIVKFCRNA